MSEHTKTPWYVGDNGKDIDAEDQLDPGAPDWCIATVDGGMREGVAEANARHIVHCVNNHERLVNALGDCCEVLEYEHAQSEEARQARALLAELDAGEGGE